jgi:hypothetical protein
VTTITLTLGILLATAVVMLALDRLEQRARRRDREIMRALHTYMAKLPPARPW